MLKLGHIYRTLSPVDLRPGQIIGGAFYFIIQYAKSYIRINAELKKLSIDDTLNLKEFLEGETTFLMIMMKL